MLASELPVLPAAVAQGVKAFFRELSSWLASVLAKGVANGSFVLESTPEREAESLMAAVHGAMLSARAYGGDAAVFDMVVQSSLKRLDRPT
jgi:TetR/AcrR family transcriptional repressor of nem operon